MITPRGLNITHNQNDSFVLNTNVTGVPQPDVIWMKDGTDLPSDITGVMATASGLQITNAQYETAGRYVLQATNLADTLSRTYDIFIRCESL